MSIIYKYLTKEIFKYLFLVLATVISIYIAVDFFEKIDDFMEAGLALSMAVSFFLLKTPFIVAQIIPVGIFLAVIIVFSLMSKNNELVALKSSGVSIYYLFKPVLITGILMSVFLFFLSEMIVPITMNQANRIWTCEVKKKSVAISKEKNIWIKGHRLITHIKYYHPADKTVFGIILNYFGKDFRLIRRVDAKRGIYKQGEWLLYELMEQRLDEKTGNYLTKYHKELKEPLNLLPEDLKRIVKKSEEMSFTELLSYIRNVEREGYDATNYRVDLYAKTSFPFVCIILCIMGTGIAGKGDKKEGMAAGIAYGIGTLFLYWVFNSFCLSLGYGEMLPPIIAAWTANSVFLCFSIYTILNAE